MRARLLDRRAARRSRPASPCRARRSERAAAAASGSCVIAAVAAGAYVRGQREARAAARAGRRDETGASRRPDDDAGRPTWQDRTDDASASELVKQLSEQTSRLVQQEMELAKAELADKGKQAGIGAGMFGGAGVFALYALGALTAR